MQILALMGILQSVLVFNSSVIKASGKPSWQLGIMLLTFVCSVIGFLLAVRWGIVAVAASFVIAGYLLAPVSYLAVHKLVRINFRTYLGQYLAPLFACLAMVAVVLGLKQLLKDQALHLYVQLFGYITAGAVTYLLIILVTARSLSRRVLDLASLALPRWRLRGISR
jgi:PST family polysaccharide transporter